APRPPGTIPSRSSAASDMYRRQEYIIYVLKMWQIVVLVFILCLIFLIYKKRIINFKNYK
ncbi:hypothetical protein BGU93_04160, partial [Clostridioides difficile]